MNHINERSSKAAIIEAAEELISNQEDQLHSQNKLLATLREEKATITALLVVISIYGLLF